MKTWRRIKKTKISKLQKPVPKQRPVFTCSSCEYQSNRLFNVERHARRIHNDRYRRYCCGMEMVSKGAYYMHCARVHPKKRPNTILSRTKYKMLGDTVDTDQRNSHSEKPEGHDFGLESKFSERICSEKPDDSDIEDVPLISFLTDHRSQSRLRASSSPVPVNETGDKSEEEASQTVKIAISSEQNIGKAASENDVENTRTKLSDLSVSPTPSVELPTKKLLLHRFRTDANVETATPLREQNNNVGSRANLQQETENQATGTAAVAPSPKRRAREPKRRIKKCHRFSEKNKENASNRTLNLNQVDIKLDTRMTRPVVSELHRDYLSSIDFDKYKIF